LSKDSKKLSKDSEGSVKKAKQEVKHITSKTPSL